MKINAYEGAQGSMGITDESDPESAIEKRSEWVYPRGRLDQWNHIKGWNADEGRERFHRKRRKEINPTWGVR